MSSDPLGTAEASPPESPEMEAKIAKAKRLSNWAPFDVHTWSDYREVDKAVNAIYVELKADHSFGENKKLRKKHVKVIVLDLYAKWLVHRERYSGIYLRKSEYRAKSRYNAIHLSVLTPKVIRQLEKAGYLELERGVNGRDGKHDSYVTRIRALPKLIDLILDHEWTEDMVEHARNRECIELRDYDEEKNKQIPIEYDDTPETLRMRKALIAYNNLIKETHIDVLGFPEGGITKTSKVRGKIYTWTYYLQRNRKFTRRIFNNGTWDNGGRFYGPWWQQIPNNGPKGGWRQRIYIMSMPTVEIDYSGLHVVLLYAQEGIDYWASDGKDPYFLPGYDGSSETRQLLKLLLLIAVNVSKGTPKEQRSAALKAIQSEINSNQESYGWVKDNGIELGKVIDDFSARHAPIKHRFFTGAGKELQRVDSMMAEFIIDKMTAETNPVLAVHDSFICEEPLYPVLLEHIMNAFESVIATLYPSLGGLSPKLKFSSPDGKKSEDYVSLFERDKDTWDRLGKEEPSKDSAYTYRLDRWLATHKEKSPEPYYTEKKLEYVVKETD